MKHSAHKADHAAKGSRRNATTVTSRTQVTSHRAPSNGLSLFSTMRGLAHGAQTSKHAMGVAGTATDLSGSRLAISRAPSHKAPGVSAVVLSTITPTKLVASLGMVAVLATGGIVASQHLAGSAVGSQSTLAGQDAVAAVGSFNPAGMTGSAVSRSEQRVSLNESNKTTKTTTGGQWKLTDSPVDQLDSSQVSVAKPKRLVVPKLTAPTVDQAQSDGSSVVAGPVIAGRQAITNGNGSGYTTAAQLLAQPTSPQAEIAAGLTPPAGFNVNHATGDMGNAYAFSQCTWWVYLRRHQLGLPAGSHMGNGAEWADTARQLGYYVSNTPHVGDVMVFQRGQAGASSAYGHVAIVEAIVNGAVITSECGASYGGHPFSRIFTDVHDFQYIHY